MPVKRRAGKSRAWRITPEAAARWREVRPGGVYRGSGAGFVADDDLAELLGWPVLVAMPPDAAEALVAALEDAGCR